MAMRMNPTKIVYARLVLRTLQLLCCVLATAFSLAGLFRFYDGSPTHSAAFTLLTSYTGALYTLWLLLSVEVLRISSRPPLRLEQGLDALLALLLLIAGICLAASNYVRYCSDYFGSKCGDIYAAVAFTFVSMFLFLASFGLRFVAVGAQPQSSNQDMQDQAQVPYRMEATPTGALSPLGSARDTPAARV